LDPGAYWQSPPPYAGDAAGVFEIVPVDKQVTNGAAFGFPLDEGLSRRNVFQAGEQVWAYATWHGVKAGALQRYRWIRPNGTTIVGTTFTANFDRGASYSQGGINLG